MYAPSSMSTVTPRSGTSASMTTSAPMRTNAPMWIPPGFSIDRVGLAMSL